MQVPRLTLSVLAPLEVTPEADAVEACAKSAGGLPLDASGEYELLAWGCAKSAGGPTHAGALRSLTTLELAERLESRGRALWPIESAARDAEAAALRAYLMSRAPKRSPAM